MTSVLLFFQLSFSGTCLVATLSVLCFKITCFHQDSPRFFIFDQFQAVIRWLIIFSWLFMIEELSWQVEVAALVFQGLFLTKLFPLVGGWTWGLWKSGHFLLPFRVHRLGGAVSWPSQKVFCMSSWRVVPSEGSLWIVVCGPPTWYSDVLAKTLGWITD